MVTSALIVETTHTHIDGNYDDDVMTHAASSVSGVENGHDTSLMVMTRTVDADGGVNGDDTQRDGVHG